MSKDLTLPMSKKILIVTLTVFLAPLWVLAAGLSVSPGALEFKIVAGEKASQTLVVANPTADVLVFEVYPDEYEELINITPQSFTLESGARKEVLVTADAHSPSFKKRKVLTGEPVEPQNFKDSLTLPQAQGSKNQILSTNISVIGSALAEGQSNVGAGAKVPLTISVSNNSQSPINKTPLIIFGVVVTAALAYHLGKKTSRHTTG